METSGEKKRLQILHQFGVLVVKERWRNHFLMSFASLIAMPGVGSWEFMFMPHGILYRDIDVGNVLNFDVYFSFDQFGLVLLWGEEHFQKTCFCSSPLFQLWPLLISLFFH